MLELRKNVAGTDVGTGTALDRDQHGASTQLETNTAFHRGVFAAGDRVSVGVMHTSTGGNLDVVFTPYQTWFERSEEHTSELQSLMRISYAVFCLKKKKQYAHKAERHQSRHTHT